MISLFVFTLATFGITYVVGHAKITLPLRTWFSGTNLGGAPAGTWLLALLECCACCGWHLGWVAFCLGLAPPELATWWIAAFYSCAACLLLAELARLDE